MRLAALIVACVAVLAGCQLLFPPLGGGSSTPAATAEVAPPGPPGGFDPAADAPEVRLGAAGVGALGEVLFLQWANGEFSADGDPLAIIDAEVAVAEGAPLALEVTGPAEGEVATVSLYPPEEWASGPRRPGQLLARLEPFADGHRLELRDVPTGDWVLVADVRFTDVGFEVGAGAGRYVWRLTVGGP